MADNYMQGLLSDPRGEMRAPPRNALMGLLADALNGANNYANRKDPRMPGGMANPVLGLLSNALSVPSLATTADRMSYGESLTNAGKANVPFLKPETADALMMAPVSPRNALAAASLGLGGVSGAERAAVYIGKQKVYQNAYHGTADDFSRVSFDAADEMRRNANLGDAFWMTPSSRHAFGYATQASKSAPKLKEADVFLKNPMTVNAWDEAVNLADQIGAPKPETWDDAANLLGYNNWAEDYIHAAKNAGHDALIIKGTGDAPIPHDQMTLADQLDDHLAIFQPRRIRNIREAK